MPRPSSTVSSSTKRYERCHERAGSESERPKPEPFVEPRRVLVDGMNDYGADSDLLRCANHAHERVVEQRRADPTPLLTGFDSEAGEDRDRDRKVSA